MCAQTGSPLGKIVRGWDLGCLSELPRGVMVSQPLTGNSLDAICACDGADDIEELFAPSPMSYVKHLPARKERWGRVRRKGASRPSLPSTTLFCLHHGASILSPPAHSLCFLPAPCEVHASCCRCGQPRQPLSPGEEWSLNVSHVSASLCLECC